MIGWIRMRIFGLNECRVYVDKTQRSFRGAIRQAVGKEAHALQREIVLGLRNQAPGGKAIRPLSPMTIALRKLPRASSKTGRPRRGSTKALIYGGDLVGSVKAKPGASTLDWTVGVHRTERNKTGQSMADIAAIHEYGTRTYTITVTPKMHRYSIFLMSQGILRAPWPVGKKLKHKTPARPYLRPAWKAWNAGAQQRFERDLAEILARNAQQAAQTAVEEP